MSPARRAALIILLLGLPGRGGASSGPGSAAAEFLGIGLGARPVALGGAFVASADDANAIAYNPAGLALLERQEATFMHNDYVDGVRQEWAAYAIPARSLGTFAVSAHLLLVEPFPAYDAAGEEADAVSAGDQAYQLAYARRAGERWSLGLGAKHLRSRLGDASASANALDAGVLYETPLRGLRAGAAIQNAGSRLRFIEEAFPLPCRWNTGLAYRPLDANPALTLLAQASLPRGGGLTAAFGAECVLGRALALRAGRRGGLGSGSGLSLGLGVALRRGGRGSELAFDYAFADYGELGRTQRFGVTVRFGAAPARARTRMEEDWLRGL